jgi:hypothetical protein
LSPLCQASFFFEQLVWLVGTLLDQDLARAYLKAKAPAGDTTAAAAASSGGHKKSKVQPGMHPADPLDMDAYGQLKTVTKYWMAGRQAFSQLDTVSVSVDISRVGGVSRMLLALALPDNQAMWLCPQAKG